jgi:DNA-binding LytR/AlgR family response regulator
MPSMNGLDLAREIKRIKSALPIVLATGYLELPPDAPIEYP